MVREVRVPEKESLRSNHHLEAKQKSQIWSAADPEEEREQLNYSQYNSS